MVAAPGRQLTGLRIRAVRRRAGITQAELALRAGISASYLNLIESNKRAIAGRLLDRIAMGLGVEREALEGEAEQRLVETLNEIAADPAVLGDAASLPAATEELVGRHGDWAGLIQRLYRAYSDQRQAVLALADRLDRHPFLSDSVHRLLTQVTAIRSAAEILESGDKLSPERRQRFFSIVADDSRNLADTAKGLVAFFDSTHTRIRSATPTEQVDAFVYESGNHFPALEEVAEAFVSSQGAQDPLGDAEAVLGTRFADFAALGGEPWRWRFAVARHVATEIGADAIASIISGHAALVSGEARDMARAALTSYLAAALLMPYESFFESAVRGRYDIDMLARRFHVSYEQAAHRLATLRRPGAEGVRFAFMRSDRAGYIDKRLPLPHLPLPRYGSACPIWPVYAAFQTPGETARGFGALSSGETFLFFARAVDKLPPQSGRTRRLLSIMLACHANDAHRTVYGDGIDRETGTAPVGTVCRLCPREECAHRQEIALMR